jgi:hypothetical protein
MQKENGTKIVEKVVQMQEGLNNLTVDEINKTQDVEIEPSKAAREAAKREGALYLEPTRKMQAFGKLPEKLKAEHKKDWEYVKGIYENYVVNGEPVKFWFSKYPGDPDCLWEVPCNQPVYVPRMIAKHLEEVQKYHTFTQVASTAEPAAMTSDDCQNMKWFRPTGTHYRGKFRPIGAFS